MRRRREGAGREGGRGGRKWDGRERREKGKERVKERERGRKREVEAENLIGRDACERRKETVDQTSRASEASVWNEDVSISRQIEQHASLAPLIFITAPGPYRLSAPVGLSMDSIVK